MTSATDFVFPSASVAIKVTLNVSLPSSKFLAVNPNWPFAAKVNNASSAPDLVQTTSPIFPATAGTVEV